MILVGNAVITDDIKDKNFVCNIEKCKGACCVEGDLGAPLTDEELPIMKEIYPKVKPYLSAEGIKAIEEQGEYIEDWEGDYSTTTINEKECAYAVYDEKNILKCGIEQAHNDGKIDFLKPISCHLYPVRITKYDEYDALNYDRWEICDPACDFGEKLGVPLYKFLKDALIRNYSKEWYEDLVNEIESENQNG
ncbi:DUF3109 family protein [Marivirga sp.]|uniref:DUF3109 family protein n=1 Tax=Marivirga sp. TaxID=2018662 RepID=UPI0025FE5FCB|nr:DUF3109 family protein [Marivirga sp.]